MTVRATKEQPQGLPPRPEEQDHSAGFVLAMIVVIAVVAFVAIAAVVNYRKKLSAPKPLPKLKKPTVGERIEGLVDTIFGDNSKVN